MEKFSSIFTVVALFFCSLIANAQTSSDKTYESFMNVANQINDFNQIASMAEALSEEELAPAINEVIALSQNQVIDHEFDKAIKKVQRAYKHGKEFKKDVISKKTMYVLDLQNKACDNLVKSIDQYLAGKNVYEHLAAALTRDKVVEYCKTNAMLSQNDAQIDYWYNTTNIFTRDEFALAQASLNK